MEDVKEVKQGISAGVVKKIGAFTKDEFSKKSRQILSRLYDFANFMEARVVLLYLSKPGEVDTRNIITYCFSKNKVVVMPSDDTSRKDMKLLKLNDPCADFVIGPKGDMVPDTNRCRQVPIDSVELQQIRERKTELQADRERLVKDRQQLQDDAKNAPDWMATDRYEALSRRNAEIEERVKRFNEEIRLLDEEEKKIVGAKPAGKGE